MKRTLLRISFFILICTVILVVQTSSSGQGSGYSNAPSESACNTSGCHSGSLVTSGTKYDKIKLINNFTGAGYIPDSTYTLYVTYKEASKSRWGFQMTALDSKNKMAGKFTSPDSRTTSYSYTISSDTRYSIGHTYTGSSSVATDSVSWKITWKAPATNVGNITFYMVLNVANNDGSTSGDVIYSKQFTVSPSTLLPVPKFKIVDSLYCTSAQLTFDASASTGSPTTYNWTFIPPTGSPINSGNQTNPKYTTSFLSVGTYKAILTVKNKKGSSLPDTLTFNTIQGATAPQISPAGLRNICQGDSLQLTVANNLANHTFLWSPQGQTAKTIKVADSGIYTVTSIYTNGCRRTAATPTTVKVNPVPSVNIIKSFSGDTICAGTPFSLGALVISGPADSFSYVSQSGPFSKNDTANKILSSGPVTYSVWGKSAKGCVSKGSSAVVEVKQPEAAPVLNASNIGYTGFTVNWSAVANATDYRISVDSGKTFIVPSSGTNGLSHDVTGLLGNHKMKVLVYGITPGNCATSEIGELTISTLSCTPLPFDVAVNGSNKVCKNSNVQVVLHQLAGKKIGIKIDGVYVGTDTIQNIKVTGTRDYDISVVDSAALICGYTTIAKKLIEDTSAIPATTPSGNSSICVSGSGGAQLTVKATTGSSQDSLLYFRNGILVSTSKNTEFLYSVQNGDSLWVVNKNKSGCLSATSAKTYVSLVQTPNAAFNASNVQFNYTFTAQDTTGTHSWKIGTDSADGKNASADLTTFKNDSVTVTHYVRKNGCSSVQTLVVQVPDFTGVKLRNFAGAKIYPNPAANRLFVYLPRAESHNTLDIYNASGSLVLSAVLNQGTNEIITETLSGGTYMFRVKTGNKETTGSIMIER